MINKLTSIYKRNHNIRSFTFRQQTVSQHGSRNIEFHEACLNCKQQNDAKHPLIFVPYLLIFLKLRLICMTNLISTTNF